MKSELFNPQKEVNLPKKIETPLNSEEGLAKLENWLKNILSPDEAEQCIFVLRSMADMILVNQCQKATKEFGTRLAEKFGDEESFFEISPSTTFSDIRSLGHLSKVHYRGDYHSVSLLEFHPIDKKEFSIIFDLSYGKIAGEGRTENIQAIYLPGDRAASLKVLKDNYGGSWEASYEFDKNKGCFVFIDDNK